ncbi:histidine kinase [Micromonospora sp. WMMD1102]|uniref:sensor histidine kinase n=1 Tax=Micromonospora sp. WMMD1102 TaxID=3016105 RepID=UPI0024157919|nr:histidine kinase [Micromonospora sp. WMMD1102]MDG4789609.1 histidine kinase [Micromonospora sp. WMMD1102]
MRVRRRWWPDLLMGLFGGAFGLAKLGWPVVPSEPLPLLVTVAAGLILVAARRWPWPVLLAECLLLSLANWTAPLGGDVAQFGALTALGIIAYAATWPATAVALGLSYAASLVHLIGPDSAGLLPGQQGFVQLAGFFGISVAPVALARYLGRMRRATRSAEERAREVEERQEVQTRAARLAERAAIARDLHDIVAHHVGAIALQAGAAQYAARRTGRVDDAVQALGELRVTAGQVLDELRALLEVLRDPDAIVSGGPTIEPEQLIMDAEQRVRAAGVAVRMNLAGDVGEAPLVVRTTAARVVQEGLTNTLKHAGPGASASVDIRPDGSGLLVEVLDTGPGQPRPALLPPSGHGLAGMRERVRLLGGTLLAGPTGGGGWRLAAHLPIREKAAAVRERPATCARPLLRTADTDPAGRPR